MLHDRAVHLKGGPVENPPTLPQSYPRPARPVSVVPKLIPDRKGRLVPAIELIHDPYHGYPWVYQALLRESPTPAVLAVFTADSVLCDGFGDVGHRCGQDRMERETGGYSESAVRVARKWLCEHGWQVRSKVLIGDREWTMHWCCWLIGSRPVAGEFDPGHGARYRVGQAPPALPSAPKAPKPAPVPAPKEKTKFQEREETTDRVDAGDVVVPATPGGEGDKSPGCEPSTWIKAAHVDPPPAAPLDPRLSEVLDREFPDPEGHAEMAERLPFWTLSHQVEWIIKVILQTARDRKVRKIRSLAAYAKGILDNWSAEGKPSLRGVVLPPCLARNSQVNAPDPARLAAEKAAKLAEQAAASARESVLRARWQALPEPDRAAIEARVRAANPGLGRWGNMLMPLCLAALEGGSP